MDSVTWRTCYLNLNEAHLLQSFVVHVAHPVRLIDMTNPMADYLHSQPVAFPSNCLKISPNGFVFRSSSVKLDKMNEFLNFEFFLNRNCAITFCGGGISCTIGIVDFLAGWLEISSGLRRFFATGFTAAKSNACGCNESNLRYCYLYPRIIIVIYLNSIFFIIKLTK